MLNLRATFTRRGRTGTIAIEAFNNNSWKRPNELNLLENLSCLSRRVVRGLGVEEDASADAGGRASPGHPDLHRVSASARIWPTRRSISNSHIEDMLNVIKYEDLRDIVLIGHSYGGMVATGVADRARDRVSATDLSRRFRARGRAVAARSQRAGAAADAGTGEESATAGACRRTRRRRIHRLPTSNGCSARRVDMPIKCFETKLKLQGGPLTLPRSYIYATRITPADTFGPFARQAQERSGLALLRDRRQPFAERHRAGSADGVAAEDRRVAPIFRSREARSGP